MIEDKKKSGHRDKAAFTQSGLFIIVYISISQCYRAYQNNADLQYYSISENIMHYEFFQTMNRH